MEMTKMFSFTCGILLGILRCATALVCADVEYSIAVKVDGPKTLSYEQAVSNCLADEKVLCSSTTICKDGKTPYGGVIPGDHWVPVADSSNEWVQIGNSNPTCILHSQKGFKPDWGLENSAQNYKGILFCCKIRRKENSLTIKAVSNTVSYQQAVVNCEDDGKQLCTSKEICEDGKTPNSGPVPGDQWVPVNDSFNEWLQIGKSPHTPCKLHSALGHKPFWGIRNSANRFKGNLYCCKMTSNSKAKDYNITVKLVADTISYPQAVASCQADKKELCTSKDICEDGKTPFGGPFPSDHWVPIKDSLNEWLQIGSYRHSPCVLHSSIGSKPPWGLTNSDHSSFKGRLFCCEKKPPEIGIFLKFVASNVTYSQAVSTCQSDGKRLCNSNEICINGKPASGVISGDHWVPVKNAFNEWMEIGDYFLNHRCLLHSRLGFQPDWGLTTVSHPYKGYLFCCKI